MRPKMKKSDILKNGNDLQEQKAELDNSVSIHLNKVNLITQDVKIPKKTTNKF